MLLATTTIMTTPFTNVLHNEFPALPISIMDAATGNDGDDGHHQYKASCSPRSSLLLQNVEMGIQGLQLVNEAAADETQQDYYHRLHPDMDYNSRSLFTSSSSSSTYPLMSSIESFLRNKGVGAGAPPVSAAAVGSSSSLPKMIIPSPSSAIYTSKKMDSLNNIIKNNRITNNNSSKNNHKSRLELWYHKQKSVLGPNDVTILNIEKARRDILRRL